MRRKEAAQAGRKLVEATTTNIPVKRMVRRLEENIGHYAVVGGLTA
jgi:hypothetical protein